MTGLYPTYHGVRINGNTALSEKHDTMAKVLSRRGYDCGAFIGAFVLDGRWGLKQGFAHYDDDFDLNKYKQLDLGLVQRPSQEVVDAAIAWLARAQGETFFRLAASLRSAHSLRPARALPQRVRRPRSGRAVRRRDRCHGRPDRPLL